MSADFYIYTDSLEEFDRADFEGWTKEQGYELELHPDFDIRENGFVPIRFRADFLGEGSWSTGFELFSSENDSSDMTAPACEPPTKKPGFFARLFGKKPHPAPQPPAYKTASELQEPSPFERAVREKKWEVCASCHGPEPLQWLVSYLFAGYFCEKFGAVIDDPQLGRFYDKAWDIKLEFEACKEDLMASCGSQGREFIPFTGWETA